LLPWRGQFFNKIVLTQKIKNRRKKKVAIAKKKKVMTTIVLFLLLAMAISLFALPIANAQAPPTFKTYAFIGAMPNPVGVNQEVLIHIGITKELASALYGWSDLSVTITRPDGVVERSVASRLIRRVEQVECTCLP